MSRWGNSSTKQARIGRVQKSRTATEDDLVSSQSLFWPTTTRESTTASANNSVLAKNTSRSWVFWAEPKPGSLPATKNHQGGLGDSEDECDAKIVSVLDSKSGQQWAPHIQLEMPRLSKQGNPERGLVENNFGTTSVSHCDQSFPRHYYNGNVQVHNYPALLHDSYLNAFQSFWPGLYLLHLIDFPWILRDCNFIQ